MAKRKSSKSKEIKVNPIVVIIIAVLIVVLTVVYFVSEPFRIKINSLFDAIFKEN